VGVSLDRTEKAATDYLAASDFAGMHALWGSVATSQAVASKYGVRAIPRTVVIDRGGIVRFNGHPVRLDRALLDSVL
jgi:hypothetical protein